ncbi:biotin synthesis protein BioG [Neisseria sp. HSC-16F19]|nr:pimeloyl-ACP methyl esterase BioG family protein [Neisseria sp. HSC-16F19]MCP2039606.1 biotin synthesis protein BioG [Neisseria sp. HSC-16F19]
MNTELLRQNGRDLLVYYAGWGTPPHTAVHSLGLPAGHDVLLCWDYCSLHAPEADWSAYQNLRLVAWSLGVWAAEHSLPAGLDWAAATAVNGTPLPIDDQYGIPAATFHATLAQLDDEGRRRFERRMCGSAEQLAHYHALPGRRALDDIHAELTAVARQAAGTPHSHLPWQHALIGRQDRIFPAAHQQHYWQTHAVNIIDHPGSHYPWPQLDGWSALWPN